jgi:hypothetical protein
MQRVAVLAASFLIAVQIVPTAHAAASPPPLRISEILPDPDSTQGQREFIEIWNSGNLTVDLAGWKIRDAATQSGSTNTFTFAAWSLAPNARVVVWGGGPADANGPAWSNTAVWNNAGDAASLLDTSGTVVDWQGYGSTSAAPAGFENRTRLPDPAKGQSLQWSAGAWLMAAPTPGSDPSGQQGVLTVNVQNVAPIAAFVAPPRSVRPGAAVALSFSLDDANGAADVKSWTLEAAGTTLASGTAAGVQQATVVVPAAPGSWNLTLSVHDQAGAGGSAAATITVRFSDLVVGLPPGRSVHLGNATPAAGRVEAIEPVSLRNDGTSTLTPLLDVSDFSGPGGSFSAQGHLWYGTSAAGGSVSWTPYPGPLAALGAVAPAATLELHFRLDNVPSPLAPGSYSTSFTVVAA